MSDTSPYTLQNERKAATMSDVYDAAVEVRGELAQLNGWMHDLVNGLTGGGSYSATRRDLFAASILTALVQDERLIGSSPVRADRVKYYMQQMWLIADSADKQDPQAPAATAETVDLAPPPPEAGDSGIDLAEDLK